MKAQTHPSYDPMGQLFCFRSSACQTCGYWSVALLCLRALMSGIGWCQHACQFNCHGEVGMAKRCRAFPCTSFSSCDLLLRCTQYQLHNVGIVLALTAADIAGYLNSSLSASWRHLDSSSCIRHFCLLKGHSVVMPLHCSLHHF